MWGHCIVIKDWRNWNIFRLLNKEAWRKLILHSWSHWSDSSTLEAELSLVWSLIIQELMLSSSPLSQSSSVTSSLWLVMSSLPYWLQVPSVLCWWLSVIISGPTLLSVSCSVSSSPPGQQSPPHVWWDHLEQFFLILPYKYFLGWHPWSEASDLCIRCVDMHQRIVCLPRSSCWRVCDWCHQSREGPRVQDWHQQLWSCFLHLLRSPQRRFCWSSLCLHRQESFPEKQCWRNSR